MKPSKFNKIPMYTMTEPPENPNVIFQTPEFSTKVQIKDFRKRRILIGLICVLKTSIDDDGDLGYTGYKLSWWETNLFYKVINKYRKELPHQDTLQEARERKIPYNPTKGKIVL